MSGAQRHDAALLVPTLAHVILPRPPPTQLRQHLCADKGYAGQPADQAVRAAGYVPHIPQRGVHGRPPRRHARGRPGRWVVERTHSWLNRYRKPLGRFEKKAESYEGLLELACALITYRQVIPIYGEVLSLALFCGIFGWKDAHFVGAAPRAASRSAAV